MTATPRKGPGVTTMVAAAVIGNAFEFFDFTVFAAYLGYIGHAFYPNDNPLLSDLASAATFGIGFISRPVGGLVLGAYADRVGRKPAMTLTLGLMALGSGVIAILPGYAQIGLVAPVLLILARLIQGFAVGGEVGPATMFMLESAAPHRRSLYTSWQIASQYVGSLVVGVLGFILASGLGKASLEDWGWRIPFAIGVLVAPVGLYIRSQLRETLTPLTEEEARNAPARSTLAAQTARLLVAMSMISGLTITIYFLLNLTPYAIRTLHLDPAVAMLATVSTGVAGIAGSVYGGWLADKFGPRPIAFWPRIVFLIILIPVMRGLVAYPGALTLVAGVLLLNVVNAMSSAVCVVMGPLMFPRRERAMGLALSYATGVALFGGTATYVVTWLVGATGDPLASVYYVFAANIVSIITIGLVKIGSFDTDPPGSAARPLAAATD